MESGSHYANRTLSLVLGTTPRLRAVDGVLKPPVVLLTVLRQ